MDDEGRSLDFLYYHMDNSFKKVMEEYIVVDIEWLECYSEGNNAVRAFARLADPVVSDKLSNLVCLFPPFFPDQPNKEQ